MRSNSLVSFPTHTDNYWDLCTLSLPATFTQPGAHLLADMSDMYVPSSVALDVSAAVLPGHEHEEEDEEGHQQRLPVLTRDPTQPVILEDHDLR